MDGRLFDGQLVRPPQVFRDVAREYVCVRITNVDAIDLNVYPFDYDLTLAVVLANADGTVYHRYGGRDRISPMHMDTLVAVLKEGLQTHHDYVPHPEPPSPKPPLILRELVNEKLRGRIQPVFGCFHCHYAREARQYLALETGQWSPDQFWIWPGPDQIGLEMNQTRQSKVDAVAPDSPAARAGLRPGDRIQMLGGAKILTKYDLQRVLDQMPDRAGELPFTTLRGGHPLSGAIFLSTGWKIGDPADYQWRVRNVFTEHMRKFLPTPGLIGDRLTTDELEALGLPGQGFGLRVLRLNYGTYLAGVRERDVILGAAGFSDFLSGPEFYRWCEERRRRGQDIQLDLLRQGARMSVRVSLSAMNDTRVEEAPRVALGFIVQELPGNDGLRVGNVIEASGAEKTGLLVGDRIVSIDGRIVRTTPELNGILSSKAPGEMLTLQVTREGELLQFGYVLSGVQGHRSPLARLSEKVERAGQEVTCSIRLEIPNAWHIYSLHRKGIGVPTQLQFRGRGYRLVGAAQEPDPVRFENEGVGPDWILDGSVLFQQTIQVLDPPKFYLVIRVLAQVCDDTSCHEFRAEVSNTGTDESFVEFRGNFDRLPVVPDGSKFGE